jgi:uncharacterized protein YaaR (DUF327 family)
MNQETNELLEGLQRARQILIEQPSFEHRAKFKQVIESFETALDDFLFAVLQSDEKQSFEEQPGDDDGN